MLSFALVYHDVQPAGFQFTPDKLAQGQGGEHVVWETPIQVIFDKDEGKQLKHQVECTRLLLNPNRTRVLSYIYA